MAGLSQDSGQEIQEPIIDTSTAVLKVPYSKVAEAKPCPPKHDPRLPIEVREKSL